MPKLVRRVPFGASEHLIVSQLLLDNGLTILHLEDHVAPVVAYQTWLRVGSAYEQPDKTGLAHLFEHLMFNETENLAAGVFDRRLEELGARNNAATWLDWTYYHELLPSDALAEVVELEAERLARLLVREKPVETEREVVANERRYRVDDDVVGTMEELLYQRAFLRHPYRWPTVGLMEHIRGFTVEDCQRFYTTYYSPNNATIIIVGDVDEPTAVGLIERCYGAMTRQTIPPPPSVVEPPQDAERRERIEWPMGAERLAMGYRAVALDHPDHAPLTVLNDILFGGRSGRLRARLLDDLELVSDVSGWVSPLRWPGLFEIHAALREGKSSSRVLEVLEEEIGRIATEEPSSGDMEKVLARLERSFYEDLDSADGKAERLGFYQTTLDDFETLFRRVRAIESVTAADVTRVARTYLDARRRTIVVAEPARVGSDR